MPVSSTLFARGSDKIYLAILLLCIILVSCFNGPFSSLLQGKTDDVDTFLYQATGIEGDIHLTDFETSDVDAEASSSTHKGVFPTFYEDPWTPPGIPDLDEQRVKNVEPYLKAIMDPKDKKFPRLRCPRPMKERYEILRRRRNFATRWDTPPRQWYFALNLYQCAHVLPRLMASVVEAIRFLRPEIVFCRSWEAGPMMARLRFWQNYEKRSKR